MSYVYDIQKNCHELACQIRRKFYIERMTAYQLMVEVAPYVTVAIDYMAEGVWAVDPAFSAPMACYTSNKDNYAALMVILSEFNVKSHKRYTKTTEGT